MQAGYQAAVALIATALFSLSAFAAEPDGPGSLITRAETLRITVEDRLSAKSSSSGARKAEQDALVDFYAVSNQHLLWVDENGLNERGKAIIAEIKKADDYGLRASDYALPILTVSTPTMPRPPIGSPTLRSKSATPCSTMRAMHGAGGLIRSA